MFTIGQFARLAKVSARTIRHYEAIGLLSSSGRGENNYRQFDSSQLDRIEKIRELQRLGFSLDEIQKILTVSNQK
jgi:DNA-binding transcriptional MerR regulator